MFNPFGIGEQPDFVKNWCFGCFTFGRHWVFGAEGLAVLSPGFHPGLFMFNRFGIGGTAGFCRKMMLRIFHQRTPLGIRRGRSDEEIFMRPSIPA